MWFNGFKLNEMLRQFFCGYWKKRERERNMISCSEFLFLLPAFLPHILPIPCLPMDNSNGSCAVTFHWQADAAHSVIRRKPERGSKQCRIQRESVKTPKNLSQKVRNFLCGPWNFRRKFPFFLPLSLYLLCNVFNSMIRIVTRYLYVTVGQQDMMQVQTR